MLDTRLMKSLLSHEFYESNKSRLRSTLFEDEIRDLYETIVEAHEKYGHDLSEDDLLTIWKVQNPVATWAEENNIQDVIDMVAKEDPVPDTIASDVIEQVWKRDIGKRIANIGLEMSEGHGDGISALKEILESHGEALMPDEFGEPTTTDLDELLEILDDDNRLRAGL